MKPSQIIFSTLTLLFVMGIGLNKAQAQKVFGVPVSQVKVNTVQESASKAVYTFQAGSQKVKLTVTQREEIGIISLQNQSCNLGSGKVSVSNGKLDFSTSDLHKGTLGIWVFAAQLMTVSNNQVALTPRQKAAQKCRTYCKNKMNQSNIVQGFAMFAGTGRQDPPVCVPADEALRVMFDSALGDYSSCFQDCMAKAKAAYNKKK